MNWWFSGQTLNESDANVCVYECKDQACAAYNPKGKLRKESATFRRNNNEFIIKFSTEKGCIKCLNYLLRALRSLNEGIKLNEVLLNIEMEVK